MTVIGHALNQIPKTSAATVEHVANLSKHQEARGLLGRVEQLLTSGSEHLRLLRDAEDQSAVTARAGLLRDDLSSAVAMLQAPHLVDDIVTAPVLTFGGVPRSVEDLRMSAVHNVERTITRLDEMPKDLPLGHAPLDLSRSMGHAFSDVRTATTQLHTPSAP